MKEKNIMTVKQLNSYIKALIDCDERLFNVYVKGEISNFTNHYKTGHFYLTLKDDGAVIRAVMFRTNAIRIKFVPKDGMKVVARGRVSVFERDGQYQLYIEDMITDGAGDLYLAFEQLKTKLRDEGLFDMNNKKSLPRIPLSIGIVTSPTGAAIRDMLNILRRRFPLSKVILYPVTVQGETAPPQIIKAINYFNDKRNVDLIIIGRGGGSIEDLWAFNDENVARTIYKSVIPLISAVGHETDFTISDFVADFRAPTPSAAAEIAVPDMAELILKLSGIRTRLGLLLVNSVSTKRDKLEYLKNSKALTSPEKLIDDKKLYLDYLIKDLTSQLRLINSRTRERLSCLSAKLNSLSPLSVLSRGYSVITDSNKNILKSVDQFKFDDKVIANVSDGYVVLNTIEKKKTERHEI